MLKNLIFIIGYSFLLNTFLGQKLLKQTIMLVMVFWDKFAQLKQF